MIAQYAILMCDAAGARKLDKAKSKRPIDGW
jgi:hypothetical protein